jgi:serine/threonine-protein phosphatase PP1 catalytic subunit
MSVSAELLCSFELLKPLDSTALKSHIKRGRNMRNNLLNSPVSLRLPRIPPPNTVFLTDVVNSLLLPLPKASSAPSIDLVRD